VTKDAESVACETTLQPTMLSVEVQTIPEGEVPMGSGAGKNTQQELEKERRDCCTRDKRKRQYRSQRASSSSSSDSSSSGNSHTSRRRHTSSRVGPVGVAFQQLVRVSKSWRLVSLSIIGLFIT
jgi:hypothetical protein